MKKFYQKEWHGIYFDTFTNHSFSKIANSEFYQLFYKCFFEKYSNWESLSSDWREQKMICARFIADYAKKGSVLSLGCGIGYIEYYIQTNYPEIKMFIHEVAPNAWEWVDDYFPSERKYLGMLSDCLGTNKFQLIYLSAVDYALPNDQLIGLLKNIRSFLLKENNYSGRCLLVSASYQQPPVTLKEKSKYSLKILKNYGKNIMQYLQLYDQGQFWGWLRTREEYQELFQQAGYEDIQCGFIDTHRSQFFWISGC